LKNTDVLAVDQDAIDATRIVNANGQQVFTKKEPNGDAIVGLFNTSATPQLISTSAATLGMAPGTDYLVKDLWSHESTETTGAISATVPSHGVAFYRVSALSNPTQAPPNATLAMSPLPNLTAGQPATATASFTDNGDLAAKQVRLGLQAPTGWSVTPTSPTSFAAVETGQTVRTTFQVVAPSSDSLFKTDTLTGTAAYTWSGKTTVNLTAPQNVTTSPPVQAPYQTFSSATDAPASFGQIGQQFGISGAGADLFSNSDAYSTVYLKGAVGATSTVDTKVVSQQGLTGFGKAGIIVRNDATGSGTTPEGVVLFASPSGGIQLEWTNDGGNFVNAVTPANGTNPFALPVWLKLERTGDSYTGYYSNDGKGWYTVGTATVSAQAATQDAGIFVTSHATGTPAQVVFNGLTAVDGAVPPPPGPKLYEAESPANTIGAPARISNCTGCSGGQKVGFVGNGGTLTFNGVTAPSAGNYDMTIYYLNGPPSRDAVITVNGVDVQTLSFTPTTDFNTVGTVTVPVPLVAGTNTIEFSNPAAYAPDFDRIAVAATPS
jgi:alpha-galactosidase